MRCSCRAVFKFFLNLEVLAAKKSLPDGYYAKPSKMNEWVKMRLNSISMNGIGFTTLNGNGLTINDRLMVKIFLGGGYKSQIEKTAVVRWVQDRDIGCSFSETDEYDKILGFYLMH